MADFLGGYKCPENVWVGVSVENNENVHRIEYLKKVDAPVRFISFEPLIGPITDLRLDRIHWAIIGGESGPGSRPIDPFWVEELYAQCRLFDVPFFFKQWGGFNKKKSGRLFKGQTFDEMPHKLEERLV